MRHFTDVKRTTLYWRYSRLSRTKDGPLNMIMDHISSMSLKKNSFTFVKEIFVYHRVITEDVRTPR